jgi:hypothetical protein
MHASNSASTYKSTPADFIKIKNGQHSMSRTQLLERFHEGWFDLGGSQARLQFCDNVKLRTGFSCGLYASSEGSFIVVRLGAVKMGEATLYCKLDRVCAILAEECACESRSISLTNFE